MYVCGITPYDATHLGHAFTYLTFDLVNRAWRDLGVPVRYAQNVTDVDDPLLERAASTGVDWAQLATAEIGVFRSDMQALRILAPDDFTPVTRSMPVIEDFIKRLRQAGAAYQVEDEHRDWYFDTHLDEPGLEETFAQYGGDPDRPGKRHRLDPLLWREKRAGEPSWPSGLGEGRPGWHVECTAIAQDRLGETIDIQGGGSDLAFPHHRMCAAQAEAVTGRPYARAFVHSAMVGLDGAKMSKSDGNLVKVAQLLGAGADPMAVRLALLAHHYREDWSWTAADLDRAADRLALWRRAVAGPWAVDFAPAAAKVRAFVREDLHADKALGVIDDWARASSAARSCHPGARSGLVMLADHLLGVGLI